MDVCVLTTELTPFSRGGIESAMRGLARLLTPGHDVTILTRAASQAQLDQLQATGHSSVVPGARYVAVPRDDEHPGCLTWNHGHVLSVLETVLETYGARGPDLVVAADYLAEAAGLIAARRGGEPALRDTRFAVRLSCATELMHLHDAARTTGDDLDVLFALERFALRHADLLWAQNAGTRDMYLRYFGAAALAPLRVLPSPTHAVAPAPRDPRDDAEPLRFLSLGRLQHAKGTLDLVDGFRRVASDEWRLTLVGGDVPTAPLDVSVRAAVEAAVAGDPRIELLGPVDRDALPELFAAHDVFVTASRFETWGNSCVEALMAGLPALVTPTCGLPELVAGERFGWVTDGFGADALATGLRRVLAERDRTLALRADPAVRAHVLQLNDLAPLEPALCEVAAMPRPVDPPVAEFSVSAVVPYHRAATGIAATLRSLAAQTHPPVEVLVINDGSFGAADEALFTLAAEHGATVISTLERGPAAARNLGARHARGEHVVFLDAGDVADASWIARLVGVIAREPDLGYVTSWARAIGPDGEVPTHGQWRRACPLGNEDQASERVDVTGIRAALVPRARVRDGDARFLEEDALLAVRGMYLRLRRRGRDGVVVPTELVSQRTDVRPFVLDPVLVEPAERRLAALITSEELTWTT